MVWQYYVSHHQDESPSFSGVWTGISSCARMAAKRTPQFMSWLALQWGAQSGRFMIEMTNHLQELIVRFRPNKEVYPYLFRSKTNRRKNKENFWWKRLLFKVVIIRGSQSRRSWMQSCQFWLRLFSKQAKVHLSNVPVLSDVFTLNNLLTAINVGNEFDQRKQ